MFSLQSDNIVDLFYFSVLVCLSVFCPFVRAPYSCTTYFCYRRSSHDFNQEDQPPQASRHNRGIRYRLDEENEGNSRVHDKEERRRQRHEERKQRHELRRMQKHEEKLRMRRLEHDSNDNSLEEGSWYFLAFFLVSGTLILTNYPFNYSMHILCIFTILSY